jgi:hypothetical protein
MLKIAKHHIFLLLQPSLQSSNTECEFILLHLATKCKNTTNHDGKLPRRRPNRIHYLK